MVIFYKFNIIKYVSVCILLSYFIFKIVGRDEWWITCL